jgi:ROS/MUCR transcriptional regulator protein
MSAGPVSAVLGPAPLGPVCRGQLGRPVVGVLADGTAYYAPVGEVVTDGGLVVCHLCGRSLRSVSAHLRVHGWTTDAYRETFGLERGQALEGNGTRKLRAAALASRLVFEPAVRDGSAAGRERARAGHLARDAAAAAKGRHFPQQRRTKTRRVLAAIPPEVIANANRERARRHLAHVAVLVAQSHGYPDIGTFVLDQVASGASLAAISRRAGLYKDWLSRHLPRDRPSGGCGGTRAAGTLGCPVAARTPPAWLPRRGQLPAPTAHCAALDRQRHRRRDRHGLPRRFVRAAPAWAYPDRSRY